MDKTQLLNSWKFLKQQYWTFIFKENIEKNISKTILKELIKYKVIAPILNGKIYALKNKDHDENYIIKNNFLEILWLLIDKKYWRNYCIWEEFALFYYNKQYWNKEFKEVKIFNKISISKTEVMDKILSFQKVNILPNFNQINFWQNYINIITKEELLLKLFDIYAKDKYEIIEKKNFLIYHQFDIESIIKKITSRKIYIIKNIYDFYIKENIQNKSLLNIFLHFKLITKKSNLLDNIEITNINKVDKENELPSVKRFKWFIDYIINYTKEQFFTNYKLREKFKSFNFEDYDTIKSSIYKKQTEEIYHSTTIEWYKVEEEEVEYILTWKTPIYIKNKEQEDLFEKKITETLIIKSYKKTLDYIVDNIIKNGVDIDIDLIKKINYYTFFEYNKNNKINFEDYNIRNHRVSMHWSDWYTPPETKEEIYDILNYLFSKINIIQNPILKSFLIHFLMIPIQPFWDWNWRLSRFLMNIILTQNWIRWIIITDHKYRLKYLSNWKYINTMEYEKIIPTYNDFISYLTKELQTSYSYNNK